MSNKIKFAVRAVLAGAALSVASTGVYAAGAVTVMSDDWLGSQNSVGANDTITTKVGMDTGFSPANGYTDNPSLNFSAWGHAVQWLTFQVTASNQVVTVTDRVLSGSNDRGFTVWASNGAFDGGTKYYDEQGASGANTPHSFNAVGQLGDHGTLWMSDPSIAKTDPSIDPLVTVGGGNLLRTLAYVNPGSAHNGPWPWVDPANSTNIVNGTDWGEVINSGVNQVDSSGAYFTSVSGNYSANVAELVFQNLKAGWYTIANGGANNAQAGVASQAIHQVTVSTSAVPLPGAVYMFGAALAGLVASSRRKQVLV